ncbi:MAG: hypothetical protein M3R32_05025 [Chloroflexota bacterium]|nr:hypothetical protein [Chloroflexota bacterium]
MPCGNLSPPDPNGDVGLSNYIQAVNSSYAIYSKAGTLQAAFTENALWSGADANPCNGSSGGDPVVLYDTLADRWILTHLAYGVSGGLPAAPFYQCIAASMTADPVSGGWWRYALRTDLGSAGTPPTGTINDYPKFGLWTDCLYFAANGFAMPAETFDGTEFASFSRSDMYAGLPLTWGLGFIANTTDPFTMIPSNLRATTPGAMPPAATPNYFVSESATAFAFEVRKFTAGTNCGGGGTLSSATNVSQVPYTQTGADSVPQPNTATGLDPLSDRLMQKVQYRRLGSTESLWVVHTVQTPSASTVSPQWAQIDVTGGAVGPTPVQEQIFAPDSTLNRWMGSIAADKDGNVALGYSTSNGSSPNFPSIAYVGRLATDSLGTMPQTEMQLVAGAGSQTNNCGGAVCHRWGDYTAMSVDPVDDCTFWYTNEYYSSQANGSSGNWQTRIGSFKFPSCISMTAPGSTYVPLTPARLLDTRFGTGLSGKFTANTPRTFQVTGLGGVPANAVAVTGNFTVTNQTAAGAAFLGPNSTASPATSTLNFPLGDTRANGVTLALSPSGQLSATYLYTAGATTDFIFDVTGYFVPDTTGASYVPLTPARLLDTRFGTGLSGKFVANIPRTFQVTGLGGVPANAVAVTGNFTVTNQTAAGAGFLGPNSTATPATSTLNFPLGDTRANGVTLALSPSGQLSATYLYTAGSTTDFIFDMTGYFVPGASRAKYVPQTPARLLDTRVANGLSGKFVANNPRTFAVTPRGGVPANAVGVTGNFTVTNQTAAGAAFLGPNSAATPPTSTLNFPLGDTRANGETLALGAGGTLSATYLYTPSSTTDFIWDVTGYFIP